MLAGLVRGLQKNLCRSRWIGWVIFRKPVCMGFINPSLSGGRSAWKDF